MIIDQDGNEVEPEQVIGHTQQWLTLVLQHNLASRDTVRDLQAQASAFEGHELTAWEEMKLIELGWAVDALMNQLNEARARDHEAHVPLERDPDGQTPEGYDLSQHMHIGGAGCGY